MIRVLLADDQRLIRAGFRALLEPEPDIEVVAEASTGAETIELARATVPDVILMDIRMPDGDGLWATEQIVDDNRIAFDGQGARASISVTFAHRERAPLVALDLQQARRDRVVDHARIGGFLAAHAAPRLRRPRASRPAFRRRCCSRRCR